MTSPLLALASLGLAWAGLPVVALDALAVGDCITAEAHVHEAISDPERLAMARCALVDGRPTDALVRLPEAGPLAGYAASLRAEALLDLGRYADAHAALSGQTLPGEAGERLRLLAGRAALGSGAPEEGKELLRGLLTGKLAEPGHLATPLGADPAEARWWLAENALGRGDTAAAIPVWQRIWTHNPTSAWSVRAAARLAEVGSPVPSAENAAQRALVTRRIQTLKSLHLYPEALALQDLLPGNESQVGLGKLAQLCFQAKDYPRAVSVYARLSAPSPSQRFRHALATSRTGDYDTAAQLYAALVEAAPSHRTADEASYKLGYLLYDAGRLEEAIPALEAHLSRYPNSRFKDSATWFSAWAAYRLGNTTRAEAGLRALSSGALAPQAHYWRARILDASDPAAAADLDDQVLRRWPDSGVAWFIHERRGTLLPSRPLAAAPTSAWAPDGMVRARSLARVGLGGWARAELAILQGEARSTGRDAVQVLAWATLEAGDPPAARKLLGACPKPGSGTVSVREQVCTPRPEAQRVMPVAKRGGLDPHLPFAIMTAESALTPHVTSPAGARGLMQLMPALAEQLHASRFPDQHFHPDTLYQPGYNATLGTLELVGLADRLGDVHPGPRLPLVIAGYNGGEEAVRRWLASDPTLELDVWTENIGYTETRRYVKRVLGYLMKYRRTYGDPPA